MMVVTNNWNDDETRKPAWVVILWREVEEETILQPVVY